MEKKKRKYSRTDKVILGIGFTILGLFVLSIAIPIIYVVLASFMDPTVLNNQGLSFNTKDWTLDAYRRVLENEMIWRGFLNSFLYSLAFAVISVFVTLLAAYPLSKKEFVGRDFFNVIFLITMFFGGGMIPTFILINQLHMVNTVWAILIPGAFNVWNMILARTYYQSIPTELREASAIDGANEIQHFFNIMLPVCKPIIAVLALWSFVGMWNSYFDAMIYLNDANLQPLQLVLRSILVQNTPQPGMIADIQSTAEMAKVAEQLKYATIVVSSLPLLVMYPFFQKYFDELEQVLIQFRDHADELEKEFSIEGAVIPMSFIINNGDQDPAILLNGFGEGYGDTGDHFAVTDEGKVIYTTVQEGYKEGIEWLHKLVTEDLVDPEAFTQEWSTYVAKGKNHRYGLCFTWDIANIDNNEDYVMLPALTGPDGMRNITRQNNSETSGYDRGRCVLTSSCRNTALAAAWIDQMYAPLQSPQNNWGTYGEKDSFNIFELSTNKDGGEMLKHMDLGDQSPVEVREAQSVNGPLAVLNEYYDVYVTQPEDAKWRLDNMHETYLQDMNSKYVYPNVFMSIDDTNKVSQYDTDIKKYAEQKKADWILNGGIEKEWDSYLKKMEQYGLSDYISIKQKYFDEYQKSLSEEK